MIAATSTHRTTLASTATATAIPEFLERAIDVDDPPSPFDAELPGAVFEVEGDVDDRMRLVELAIALLAERADGLCDRRVFSLGFGDSLDRLHVLGIRKLGSSRCPEGDRDRAIGLVREFVA